MGTSHWGAWTGCFQGNKSVLSNVIGCIHLIVFHNRNIPSEHSFLNYSMTLGEGFNAKKAGVNLIPQWFY